MLSDCSIALRLLSNLERNMKRTNIRTLAFLELLSEQKKLPYKVYESLAFYPGCFSGDLGSNSAIIRVVFTSLSEPILLKIHGGEAIYKQTWRVEAGEGREEDRTSSTASHIWATQNILSHQLSTQI